MSAISSVSFSTFRQSRQSRLPICHIYAIYAMLHSARGTTCRCWTSGASASSTPICFCCCFSLSLAFRIAPIDAATAERPQKEVPATKNTGLFHGQHRLSVDFCLSVCLMCLVLWQNPQNTKETTVDMSNECPVQGSKHAHFDLSQGLANTYQCLVQDVFYLRELKITF